MVVRSKERKTPETIQSKKVDTKRREFLRKSMYVAYATPLIMSVLVEKASAGWSSGQSDCSKYPPCPPPNTDICLPPGQCDKV